MVDSRGLTLDESMLTGESDGIRKRPGERMLSGSFGLSGSGHYEVDAVREDSYAEKIAGEAREFRHPPSPLQVEVNQVLKATTIALVAARRRSSCSASALHDKAFREAAQKATAGLVTLIPEGLVLLMSVTLAVAAVRLARQNTLVQQMAATEALAAVDTICVDKTGTLTDGSLELVKVEVADPDGPAAAERALATFAASAGERNRTLEAIAERYPARAASGQRRGPVLLRVEVERVDPERLAPSYVTRRPRRARRAGALEPAGGAASARSRSTPRPGAGWSPSAGARRAAARRPGLASRRRRSSRWRWSCSRRRCAPTPPRRSSSCASSRST